MPSTEMSAAAIRDGPMKRMLLLLVLSAVVVSGGAVIYLRLIRRPSLPEGLIQANGRIEGDHITVTSKFAGRVVALKVQEGDAVSAGQVLVQLDDTQVRARLDQAKHNILALTAQVRAGQTSLEVLTREVALQIEAAQAEVAYAKAKIEQAEAGKADCEIQLRRLRRASESDAATQYELERTGLALKVAEKDLTAARTKLAQAEANLANAKLGDDRIRAKKAELESLEAQVGSAKAAGVEAQSVLDDMTLRAPAKGVVTTRIANLGEVLPAGAPVFEMVDLDRLYLKVYVPEAQIGRLRLGLKARIYTDAFPATPFDATVRYVSSQAEFTPKEVQTPDERVKLVFAVKLYLDVNPDHRLTPGLPADAVVRWREDTPWKRPRW